MAIREVPNVSNPTNYKALVIKSGGSIWKQKSSGVEDSDLYRFGALRSIQCEYIKGGLEILHCNILSAMG